MNTCFGAVIIFPNKASVLTYIFIPPVVCTRGHPLQSLPQNVDKVEQNGPLEVDEPLKWQPEADGKVGKSGKSISCFINRHISHI